MSGREAKEALILYYGMHRPISCRKGRGTAHSWLYIDLGGQRISQEQKDEAAKEFVEHGLCGTYYSDCGPGDSDRPCIRWENYILTDGSGETIHDLSWKKR